MTRISTIDRVVPSAIGPLGAHRLGYSGMRDHKSRPGTAHLEKPKIGIGAEIWGPETKGKNCRIPASGDRNPSERKKKTPPIAGLSRQSLQNAKTADWVVADAVACEPVSHAKFP